MVLEQAGLVDTLLLGGNSKEVTWTEFSFYGNKM